MLGTLALESLHRQVLPFILRRLKEDVLTDLPPKIIQDYYCELSPLQVFSIISLFCFLVVFTYYYSLYYYPEVLSFVWFCQID